MRAADRARERESGRAATHICKWPAKELDANNGRRSLTALRSLTARMLVLSLLCMHGQKESPRLSKGQRRQGGGGQCALALSANNEAKGRERAKDVIVSLAIAGIVVPVVVIAALLCSIFVSLNFFCNKSE